MNVCLQRYGPFLIRVADFVGAVTELQIYTLNTLFEMIPIPSSNSTERSLKGSETAQLAITSTLSSFLHIQFPEFAPFLNNDTHLKWP